MLPKILCPQLSQTCYQGKRQQGSNYTEKLMENMLIIWIVQVKGVFFFSSFLFFCPPLTDLLAEIPTWVYSIMLSMNILSEENPHYEIVGECNFIFQMTFLATG